MVEIKEKEKLPEGWKKVRLGEICNLSYGKNLPADKFKEDGKYKVYGANGIIGFYDRYTHEEATILVSCRGEYSGVINITEPKSYVTNNSIPLVIKDKHKLQTKFLYYSLKLTPRKSFVSGSAQPQVVINDLKFVNIIFPESAIEQLKIAEILETVDNAIEKTDKIIEKYKRIKQGLMQDLLTKGINKNGNIRSEETHKFKDSPLGRIPEEWEVVRLGDVMILKNGKAAKILEEGKYPIYGSNGLIGYTDNYYLNGTFILIGRVGASGEIHMARGKLWASDNCLVGECKSDTNPVFMYYLLKHLELKKSVTQTAQPLITQSFISNIYISFPPLPEQHRIASILSQIDETIEKEQRYKEKLERIKRGLMEDLLTGKVRVNHLIEGVKNVS